MDQEVMSWQPGTETSQTAVSVVHHTFNPNTWDCESGVSLIYTVQVRPSLKRKQQACVPKYTSTFLKGTIPSILSQWQKAGRQSILAVRD